MKTKFITIVSLCCLISILSSTKPAFAQSGQLDPSFGTSGSVRTFINGGKSYNKDDRATSVALQSDGKIVVAGKSEDDSYNYAFALARFKTDGSLDSTFGVNGTLRNYIIGGSSLDDEINSIAIQSDGKIIAAGSSLNASGNIAFALARYNTDGSLDNTFGNGGTVRNNISSNGGISKSDYAFSVTIQSDGKIVAAGYSHISTGDGFALARYNTNGSLDSTFGYYGTIRNNISGGDNSGDRATCVAMQSDNKIVAAGYSSNSLGFAFALARYKSDGSLDSTFGTKGSLISNIGGGDNTEDIISSLVMQPDGMIIAAGQSVDSLKRGFALARYNMNGNLDNTFGTGGTVRNYIIGGNSSNDNIGSVALQSDGMIVAAGWSEDAVGYTFAIARYKKDGSLDNSFNNTGMIRNHISGGSNYYDGVNSVAIQSDGKIVAAGWDEDILLGDAFAVARYSGTPTSVMKEFLGNPAEFAISQNYPNPFNPSTIINYTLPRASHVVLKIYDITGHEVTTLVNEEKNAGSYNIEFNAHRLASGVYFYRIQAGNIFKTKQMILLK